MKYFRTKDSHGESMPNSGISHPLSAPHAFAVRGQSSLSLQRPAKAWHPAGIVVLTDATRSSGMSDDFPSTRIHPHPPADPLCARFEEEWRQGKQPRIEDYLRESSAIDRDRFFLELLSVELSHRTRAGETCQREEYASRFPAFQSTLKQAFEL